MMAESMRTLMQSIPPQSSRARPAPTQSVTHIATGTLLAATLLAAVVPGVLFADARGLDGVGVALDPSMDAARGQAQRAAATAGQQNLWGSPIVTPEQVRDAMNDPRLVILHFGSEEGYRSGRIPGARFAEWQDFEAPPGNPSGLRRELPDPEALQSTLRELGINDDSRILLYYDSGLEPNLTRILFTLDWAGLGDRTAAMLGGVDIWTDAGGGIMGMATSNPPAPGQVTVRPRSDLLVTADEVARLATTPGHVLIDARAAAFYDGVREDQGKAGHIPGAANLPHIELFTENRTYHAPEELGRRLAEVGVTPGDRIVVYCHVGFFGTTIVTAARMLGYEAVLYDGSWEHWAASDRPVAVD